MLDISQELIIKPYSGGIKLCAPNYYSTQNEYFSVKDLLSLSCPAYFINSQFVLVNCNELSANACSHDSIQSAIGTSTFDNFSQENARVIVKLDREVMREKQSRISNDVLLDEKGTHISYLTVKAPIYNASNEVIAIFGCSIDILNDPLADTLTSLQRTGIFNSTIKDKSSLTYHYDESLFTKRQNDVIHHLVRGHTCAEIGVILHLSTRTIENYMAAIKDILNVTTKSELLDKLIDS